MQNKKYDEAIAEYEKALEFDENYAYAHYNLGVLYDSYKKQPEKAIAHYEKYLKLMPDEKDAAKVKEWLGAARGKIGK